MSFKKTSFSGINLVDVISIILLFVSFSYELTISKKDKMTANSFFIATSLLQTKSKLNMISSYINHFKEIEVSFPEIKKDDTTLFAYYDHQNKKIQIESSENKNNEKNLIAKGTYEKNRFKNGWDNWDAFTYKNANPIMQCYSIGIIEGLLSHEEIYDYRKNFELFFNSQNEIDNLKNLLKEADSNVIKKINATLSQQNQADSQGDINNDPKVIAYLSCLHAQIYGLYKGYSKQAPEEHKLDVYDLYFLNTEGYYSGLINYLSVTNVNFTSVDDFFNEQNMMTYYNTTSIEKIWKTLKRKSHCSAVIKKVEDNLFFGHNTWTGYNELLRTIRKVNYEFEGENGTIGLKPFTMTYSSYPGIMFSGDDFYTIDKHLAIMQTSLSVINIYQYKNAIDSKTYIPEYMRIMIINFLSKTAEEWTNNYLSLFKGNHLYETTWMIVDFDKIKEDKKYFYVVEELPKSVKYIDYSQSLDNETFFGSFNIPFFKDTHSNIVGMHHFVNTDFYDKFNNPRRYILKHLQNTIKDLESFEKVLMYNGYQVKNETIPDDPSFNDAGDGIASRGTGSGAIDFKIVDKDLLKNDDMYIYSGPVYDSNPNFEPFNVKQITSELKNYLRGLPEVFDFKPFFLNQQKQQQEKNEDKKKEKKKKGNLK